MPKSKNTRGKKYHPKPIYGNRVITPKPKWMKTTKNIAIVALSILLLMAIAGMVIKYHNHLKYHK